MAPVAIVRGAFLNPNELANYNYLGKIVEISTISSQYPIGTSNEIPNYKLTSPYDCGKYFPFGFESIFQKAVKFILNRVIGDPHVLFNLENRLDGVLLIDTADPYYFYSYQAIRFKKKHPETKVLCTYCETRPFRNEGTILKKKIKKDVICKADMFVCHTIRSRDALIKDGANKDRIRIVPLGVDLDRFSPKKHYKHNLLFVGRLVREKGILILWEAFKRLSCDYPDWKLTICGSGYMKRQIKTEMKKAGLEKNVCFTSLPYARIHEIYQSASIFVMPSYSTATWEEQYGMVLVEAMASGLPIVASRSGAIPEVLGDAGFLVKEKSIRNLVKTLKALMDSNRLRKTYGNKARERAKRYYNAKSFADKINSIYEELIGSHYRTK